MNIGDTWKGWTVESVIGEGTFGSVYRIVREEFGHVYESALKVIRVPQSSAELASLREEGMSDESITLYYQGMIEEIVSEISIMSKLRGNSNIVSYEDHKVTELDGEFGWSIYIRMEMLTPLYTYINDHPMSEKDVVKLGIDICRALEVCQHFNIIHRDIKPENIFVSAQGTFKLGDFGIAKQLDKASQALSKKGTYTYMAPEVYREEPYGATVDTYSLGIVLYRFLNDGRTPFMPPAGQPIRFQDKDKATARRMLGEQLPPPSGAQPALSDIILKACAFAPGDRFSNATEMRQALESLYPDEFRTVSGAAEMDWSDDPTLAWDPSGEDEEVTLPWKEAAASQAPANAPPDNKSNKSHGKLFGIIAAAAAVLVAGYFIVSNLGKVTVPYTVGLSEDEAQAAIEEAGFVYAENREFSEDIDQGTVISQSAAKGESLKEGSEINVVVSRGEALEVPDTLRKTKETAKKRIEAGGFVYKLGGDEYSIDVASGYVCRQDPGIEENAEAGQTITVWVSKGPDHKTVPDVTGMTPDKARAALQEFGLRISVGSEHSDSVPSGQIISQDPAPGETVDEGTIVRVNVSIG